VKNSIGPKVRNARRRQATAGISFIRRSGRKGRSLVTDLTVNRFRERKEGERTKRGVKEQAFKYTGDNFRKILES